MDQMLPEPLMHVIEKRIHLCKRATTTDSELLFLHSPAETRKGVKRYYLSEPERLNDRGLALGLDDWDSHRWWTALVFPEGVRAYSIINADDACVVTVDSKTETRLSWQATASNGGERILKRFIRFAPTLSELTHEDSKGPKYSFSTHGLFICCVANEHTTVNRTEPGEMELLGRISNHVRTLKSARSRDKLTPSDCVINPSFGEHHIHIALMLTVIRMWFLGWDFRSGG